MSNDSTPPNLADLLGDAPLDTGSNTSSDKKESSSVSENIDIEGLLNANPIQKESIVSDTNAPSLTDLLAGDEETKKNSPVLHCSESSASGKTDKNPSDTNIFQKALNEKGEEKESHIIDAIENYSGDFEIDDLGEERIEDPVVLMKKKEQEIFSKEESKWKKIIIASQSFAVFSFLFGISSFFIFSFLLDTPEHGVLGNMVSHNYGIEKEKKRIIEEDIKKELSIRKKEIKKIEKTIEGLENNTILDSILSDRINWIQALKDMEKVRKESQSIEEGKYIFLENYSTKGKMENGKVQIVVTGKVYSYKNVFQKTSKLIDSFNESANFEGATMNRFDKTDNGRQYYMSFSLQLDYYPKGKIIKITKNN